MWRRLVRFWCKNFTSRVPDHDCSGDATVTSQAVVSTLSYALCLLCGPPLYSRARWSSSSNHCNLAAGRSGIDLRSKASCLRGDELQRTQWCLKPERPASLWMKQAEPSLSVLKVSAPILAGHIVVTKHGSGICLISHNLIHLMLQSCKSLPIALAYCSFCRKKRETMANKAMLPPCKVP